MQKWIFVVLYVKDQLRPNPFLLHLHLWRQVAILKHMDKCHILDIWWVNRKPGFEIPLKPIHLSSPVWTLTPTCVCEGKLCIHSVGFSWFQEFWLNFGADKNSDFEQVTYVLLLVILNMKVKIIWNNPLKKSEEFNLLPNFLIFFLL